MKRLAKILLTIPVTLLLLHSLVQHKHVNMNDGSMYIQGCSQPESGILAFLRHAFEMDERENHLENIEIEDNSFPKLLLAKIKADDYSISQVDFSQPEKMWTPDFCSPTFNTQISLLSFRGPPSFA